MYSKNDNGTLKSKNPKLRVNQKKNTILNFKGKKLLKNTILNYIVILKHS